MSRRYLHLSLEERRKIAIWRYAKTPAFKIADRFHRNPSTICREIKRNPVRFDDQPELNGYHAFNAQDLYEDRRAIHRKLILHPEIMAAVRSGFDAGLLSSLQAATAGQPVMESLVDGLSPLPKLARQSITLDRGK